MSHFGREGIHRQETDLGPCQGDDAECRCVQVQAIGVQRRGYHRGRSFDAAEIRVRSRLYTGENGGQVRRSGQSVHMGCQYLQLQPHLYPGEATYGFARGCKAKQGRCSGKTRGGRGQGGLRRGNSRGAGTKARPSCRREARGRGTS